MAENGKLHDADDVQTTDAAFPPSSAAPSSAGLPAVALNIFPPSKRTRDAVIQRLVDTLSSPSVLTKRYGVVPADEAADTARLIEQEAFDAANSAAGRAVSSIEDGLADLQIYSKEISKRMIESVKLRASSTASTAAVEDAAGEAAPVPAESDSTSGGANEERPSVERKTESPSA